MKLNNYMRNAIVAKILDEVRRPREAALKKRENAIALRLTIRRYGKDVFERCRELPAGWLGVHKEISFDYDLKHMNFPRRTRNPEPGSKGRASHWPFYYNLELSDAAVLPNSFSEPWTQGEMGHLYDEVYSYFADLVALDEELDNLAIQTRAVLTSFATVEKLADGWPEGYAHLPQELLAETGGVPAPRIEDLNKRISALKAAA